MLGRLGQPRSERHKKTVGIYTLGYLKGGNRQAVTMDHNRGLGSMVSFWGIRIISGENNAQEASPK